MKVPFRMSQIGQGQEEATVVFWAKAVGDTVQRGDVVVTVEAEKAELDVESFGEGVLTEILSPVGATVTVGEIIAYLDTSIAPGERP